MSKESSTRFEAIYKHLFDNTDFKNLLEKLQTGKGSVSLSGLSGSSKYFLASAIYKATKKPFLLICPTRRRAESAASNLSFFLKSAPAVLLKKEPGIGEAVFSSKAQLAKEKNNWLYSAILGEPLIAEIDAIYEKTIPRKNFEALTIDVCKGDLLIREELLYNLQKTGYVRADFVQGRGDFSSRGSILDIFSPGHQCPIRIEFIGDEVGSIREFSVEDQKTTKKLEGITILPVSAIALDEKSIERGSEYLRAKAEEQGVAARSKNEILEPIEKGHRISNMEWLLPAFYSKLGSIFDYLPDDILIIEDEAEENSNASQIFLEDLSETQKVLNKQLNISPDIDELYHGRDFIKKSIKKQQSIIARRP